MIPPHPSGIGWDSPARTMWGSRRRAHQPSSRTLVWASTDRITWRYDGYVAAGIDKAGAAGIPPPHPRHR